jgi:protein O-mannosyl-transferase
MKKAAKRPGRKRPQRAKSASKAKRRSSPTHDRTGRWLVPAICFALVASTLLVFGRTVRFDFFNYDDSFYVYENPFVSNGLTRAGLVRAFTHPLVGNWHPLTSISLMLNAQWSGLHAGSYHLVNVLLHALAVLLLLLVLRTMTGALWRSAFVAALFAIHPLRAESVVWISERKDVLSGVFFLLGLWAYSRYAKKPPALGRYLLVVLALVLGLLSKAMLVTFPFVLLLLDYWPLKRFAFAPINGAGQIEERTVAKMSRLILEKLPLVLLAIAASVATILAQEPALKAAQDLPLSWRVENALLNIWVYLRQMVWPSHLAVFYPHPRGTIPLWLVSASAVALLALTATVVSVRKRYPYLVTGWFWYLGMLVPVLGLVQVGWQAHADRYTYLPQIGIYLMISWGVADLTAGWRRRQLILGAAATLLIAGLMMLAARQVEHWSSSVKLWQHTLAVTTGNDVAERGLGTALIKLGQVDEAIAHDRAALRIRPGDTNGLTNLANALLKKGDLAEAIEHFREAVRLRPNDNMVRRNLGKALFRNGAIDQSIAEFREALRIGPTDSDAAYSLGNALLRNGEAGAAIPYFRKAIELKPNDVAAHYNLAIALQRDNQFDAAIAEFRETLRLDPRKVDAHNNLAITFLKNGLAEEAISEWRAALQVEPGNAELHNNLAVAFLAQGRIAETVAEWQETLRLQPDKVGAEISLAWVLATAPEDALRNGARALELAQHASQISAGRNLMTYRVLAAAHAETGQFQAAISAAQEGARRAENEGQAAVAQALQLDLSLYEQSVPLRDPSHGRGRAAFP